MKKSLLFSLSLIGEIGFATALPLVLFGKLGDYLDQRLSTAPYLLYSGVILGVVQGGYYVYLLAKRAIKIVEEISKEEK